MKDTIDLEKENLRLKVAELESDIEDFCYVTVEFLQIMGINISDIRDGIKTKDVIKSIKSKLFMLATDDDGFGALFASFAPEALRVGEKYEELAKQVTARKHKEKGI